MAKVVKGLYYSNEHEWVKVEGNIAYIGITDHAQDSMGDIVYADTGALDATVSKGDAVAVLESVKAASDVYTPVSGTIVKVNEGLADSPELLNQAPYENYLFAVEMSDAGELSELMDADAYAAFCEEAAE